MSTTAEIVVIAIVDVRPEAREQALAALTAGIEATHGEEGCVAYALHEDIETPGRFVIVEKWATAAALDEHAQTSHLKAMFTAVGPLLLAPPTIVRSAPLPVGDAAKATI
jgi:quinol monooxygenase YgiN